MRSCHVSIARAQFERAILGLCDQHDVKIVFATTDHDALAVATLAPKLRARGIIAAVADAALLRAWADKVVCLRDASAAGLPVLPIIEPEQSGCTYPLIGKPRHGWGGRGHVIVRSSAETEAASRSDPDHRLFWQPLLDSYDEWSVDFAVRESGEVSPLVVRQRLRTSGGFAVVSRVRRDTPVAELASRAAQLVAQRGACGPVNLQILVDSRGSQWLNDVNLRPGTSATAALAAGVDFAAFMLNEPARFAERSDFVHVRTLCDTIIPMPFAGPIEAVAFDLDDCLIDQKEWMDRKLSVVLAAMTDGPLSEADRRRFELEGRRAIDEGPWDRTIDIALARAKLDIGLRQPLIDAWRTAHPDRVSFYDDAAAAWRSLRKAGLKLAVVTDIQCELKRKARGGTSLNCVTRENPDSSPDLPPTLLLLALRDLLVGVRVVLFQHRSESAARSVMPSLRYDSRHDLQRALRSAARRRSSRSRTWRG